MTEAERKQFAAENAEPIYTSPEERAQIEAIVAEALKRQEFKDFFATKIRAGVLLEDAWRWSKIEGDCPFFNGVERDGDPTGAPQNQIILAWKTFAESPIFASYYTLDKNSPRGKVLGKVMDMLYSFMNVNLVNMTLPGSWAACFGLLQNIGVLPAPVPTEAQLAAVENSKPASDGQPVAIHDSGPNKGKPVTYVKDGKTIRYSAQMLEQLTSKGYAMVMGIQKSARELQETEDQRRARKAHEYRTVIVAGGYTQKELDAMPSEKYREVMQLSRAPMQMKPFDRL